MTKKEIEDAIEFLEFYDYDRPTGTDETFGVATDALREILLYHEIGTVEECRIAVENQKQGKKR